MVSHPVSVGCVDRGVLQVVVLMRIGEFEQRCQGVKGYAVELDGSPMKRESSLGASVVNRDLSLSSSADASKFVGWRFESPRGQREQLCQ